MSIRQFFMSDEDCEPITDDGKRRLLEVLNTCDCEFAGGSGTGDFRAGFFPESWQKYLAALVRADLGD